MLGIFNAVAGSNAGILAIILGMFAASFVLFIGAYIFISFVFMSLAKKAGQDSPGLAWIPMVGPLIIAYKSSGMHWWPWLLFIGIFIPILNFVFTIAIWVISIVWMWKLFEAVGRPGWWAILLLVPVVGIVMLILAAWTDVGLKR